METRNRLDARRPSRYRFVMATHCPSNDAPTEATSSIDLDHSVGEVWAALVDPACLSEWMGPGSSIEPWPGGDVAVADIATGQPKRGRITEIVPERSINLDWWPADDPGQVTQVSFLLIPLEHGTRLTVTEKSLPGVTLSARASALASSGAWRLALLSVAPVAVGVLRVQ